MLATTVFGTAAVSRSHTTLILSRVSLEATISNYSPKTYWMQLTAAVTAENWQPIRFRGAV